MNEYNNFPMRPLGWKSPNEFLSSFFSKCNKCIVNLQPCLKEYSITACLNLRSCVILAIVSCAPFVFFAQLNNKLNRAKLTTFFAIPRLPLGGGFLFGFRLFFLPLLLVPDMRLCNKCIVNLHSLESPCKRRTLTEHFIMV